MLDGVIDALIPVGADANRLTVPVNPFSAAIVIADVPGVTVSMETVAGLALIEKSGAITVIETSTVCMIEPLVPTTTTV